MFKRFLACCSIATLPITVSAATLYEPGVALNFSQAERQSVWGPGQAAEISGTKFVGAEWDDTLDTGVIVGGVSTTTVPDITFAARLATWEACKNSIFSKICGSKPKDGTFSFTVDTRTGAEGEISSDGRAGVEFNYDVSAGSYSATVEFNATAEIPDAIKRGQSVQLNPTSEFTDGEIDSKSPTASGSIDAVLKVDASASGTGCVIGFGCATGTVPILDIDEDRELIGITPFEVTYLDGFTPDLIDLKTPLAGQSVGLKAGVTAAGPIVFLDIPGVPGPDDLIGATLDLGSLNIVDPTFEATGGKVGNALEVNADSVFLELFADLDTLFGVPGGVNLSAGPVGVSLDAYDFNAGPTLGFFQDLKLVPTLMAELGFSRPVEIAGNMVESFTGVWDALPEITFLSSTLVTPKFFLDATLESTSGMQFGLSLVMDFLKATLSLSPFNVTLLEAKLGPLFSSRLNSPNFGQISLFDDTFEATGFNTIHADAFLIEVQQVPLPTGLPLLAAGLGAFALMRRRQSRSH